MFNKLMSGLVAPAVAGNVIWTLGQFFLMRDDIGDDLIARGLIVAFAGAYLVLHWIAFEGKNRKANNWSTWLDLVHYTFIATIVLAVYEGNTLVPFLLIGFFSFNAVTHLLHCILTKDGSIFRTCINVLGLIICSLTFVLPWNASWIFALAMFVTLMLWVVSRWSSFKYRTSTS